MSNVTRATFCKHCQSEILNTPKGYPDRCPECFKIIVKPDNKYFESPRYILQQKEHLVEELTTGNKIEPDSYDYRDIMTELQKEEDKWFRTCLHEDRAASLRDALEVIRHLPYTRSNKEELFHLLNIGIKIGEISKSIHELYKTGVSLYDRETRSLRPDPRDTLWDQASTATSRDT